jgi:hypothetical protein
MNGTRNLSRYSMSATYYVACSDTKKNRRRPKGRMNDLLLMSPSLWPAACLGAQQLSEPAQETSEFVQRTSHF